MKRTSRKPSWLLPMLGVAVLAGLTPSARAQLPEGCSALNFPLVEHTCFHARFGPFQERVASDGQVPSASTPAIDSVHTHYRIALTPGRVQAATYQPARSGAWAMFLDPDVPWSLRRPDGSVVTPLVEHDVTDCPFLPRVRVFELVAGVRYTYVFQSSDASSVVVVNEKVDDFAVAHGRDSDGDGYGDSATTEFRACLPLEGFVENDDDCDDSDPDVHPGAHELCDGTDENCNGVIDDVGVSCLSGVGVCADRGVLACPVPGAPAVCDGVPTAPLPSEACNGEDDDCDGATDESEALCVDPDRPFCVSNGPAFACGCERDADCGGPASGRLCFLMATTQVCVDGCVSGWGRNGCPAGEVCTSSDPTTPGACVPGCTSNVDCLPRRCDVTSGLCEDLPMDAGPPDADVPNDADTRMDMSVDAGSSPSASSGCGCRVEPTGADSSGLAFFALLAAACARRRRRRTSWAAMMGMLPWLGCAQAHTIADSSVRDGGAPDDGVCVPRLGAMPIEHSCLHVERGPLRPVDATPSSEALPPSVSAPHAPYDVFVPGDGERSGFVAYQALRNGQHVVFLGPDARLTVADGNGNPIEALHVQPTEGCAALASAHVVDLERFGTYRLALQPAPSSETVVLFVEHVETFGGAAWEESCEEP